MDENIFITLNGAVKITIKYDRSLYIYKVINNKIVLSLAMYVDDTLCLGHKEELEWMYKEIQKKFKIEKLGTLKKHLGLVFVEE
jgi:hypothetical protein